MNGGLAPAGPAHSGQDKSTMVAKEDLTAYGADDLVEAMKVGDPSPLKGLRRGTWQYYRDVAANHGVKYLDKETAAHTCKLGTIHR